MASVLSRSPRSFSIQGMGKNGEKWEKNTLSRSSESFSFQERSPLEIQWQSDCVVNLGHSCSLLVSTKSVKFS